MKLLFVIVKLAIAAYLVMGVLLYALQRSYLYHPTPKFDHSYPVETLSVDGATLELISLNSGGARAVIYFGGNGEAVALSAEDLQRHLSDAALYLVNYRGYGGSSGAPSEQALYRDALSIYSHVASRHESVSVVGRSLGSGIASYLAAERDIARLVLITPFDSVEAVARERFPYYPVTLLLKDKYDSIGRVGKISAETLLIVAENDRVIPAKFSQRLIDRFPAAQAEVAEIKGAGHNSLSNRERYWRLLSDFLP